MFSFDLLWFWNYLGTVTLYLDEFQKPLRILNGSEMMKWLQKSDLTGTDVLFEGFTAFCEYTIYN